MQFLGIWAQGFHGAIFLNKTQFLQLGGSLQYSLAMSQTVPHICALTLQALVVAGPPNSAIRSVFAAKKAVLGYFVRTLLGTPFGKSKGLQINEMDFLCLIRKFCVVQPLSAQENQDVPLWLIYSSGRSMPLFAYVLALAAYGAASAAWILLSPKAAPGWVVWIDLVGLGCLGTSFK